MNVKSLLKDTAIYGASSIVGRFLNYLLVPLYTIRIASQSGGYGIVTNLYAYTALFLAILTFGMETTLFRFSGKSGYDADKVYGTSLRMVGGVALAFVALVGLFLSPISSAMGYSAHPEYIACMAVIVALDAFQAIMFSRLRQQHKPVKFALLKFAFIIPNVLLNLGIFLVLPRYFDQFPVLADIYNRFDCGVGLIFFVNFLCTFTVTFLFGRELAGIRMGFDKALAKEMLAYALPLLLLSIVGILNQVADKILFPYLVPGEEGRVQLGIYGACVKVAMIMALLTQAFRYAFEPIVFGAGRTGDEKKNLADGMKFFIAFSLLAYLAVIFYMPILKYIIGRTYWEGLDVVPVVMAAEVFMGIYFNLSFWYKLSDETWWGALFSLAGAVVMIAVNVAFVPRFGYWACAWGGFAGYGVSMVLSGLVGQKKNPVQYDVRKMALYVALAAVAFGASRGFAHFVDNEIACLAFSSVLLAGYAFALKKI